MKHLRKSKDTTEIYTSFEELRSAFGLDPIRKQTKDKEKLKSQREKFVKTCPVCKQSLSYIYGSNVVCCQNPECKGIEKKNTNADGTENVWYIPVTRTLDEKGMEIAMNLFE